MKSVFMETNLQMKGLSICLEKEIPETRQGLAIIIVRQEINRHSVGE